MLREVGIDQHLNASLLLDIQFRDEANRSVRLQEYFHERPVIVALVYYRCPMLCTQVLNGILKASQAMPLEMGSDYDVIAISIDPKETSELAAEKKRHYSRSYRRPGGEKGWHFLTGDQASIERVAQVIGYRYRYDQATGQYAHSSGIVIVTPEGRLSRYFFGIDYPPNDLRLALVESSSGKIGSLADQVLLLCYHYDPLTGRYGLAISRALTASSLLTVAALSVYLYVTFRREMRRPKLFRDQPREASA
jgi:protein SCO1/2